MFLSCFAFLTLKTRFSNCEWVANDWKSIKPRITSNLAIHGISKGPKWAKKHKLVANNAREETSVGGLCHLPWWVTRALLSLSARHEHATSSANDASLTLKFSQLSPKFLCVLGPHFDYLPFNPRFHVVYYLGLRFSTFMHKNIKFNQNSTKSWGFTHIFNFESLK